MTMWKPIETAPRDGTEILVWSPKGVGMITDHPARHRIDRWQKGQWWRSFPAQQPTHWMPLPLPPSD